MAGPLFYDRIKETATTTGTGTFTLAGAVSGYLAFSTVGNANTCYYTIVHQSANEWEVGLGTYTLSGTTLARTAVLSSTNSNAAVNFSAGTKDVFLDAPAAMFGALDVGTFAPQFRLTTESGVPVSTSDRATQGTLYLTPCTLTGYPTATGLTRTYTGNRIRAQESAEVSLALTLTSGKLYDVFQKNSDLSMVLSSAWTNDTTRADAITTIKNLPVANADNTYTWMGTIRASATDKVEDSATKRFISSNYNRVLGRLQKTESTGSWTYDSTTIHQANASTANQVEVVVGSLDHFIVLNVGATLSGASASVTGFVGIGEDSTTASVAEQAGGIYPAFITAGLGTTFGSSNNVVRKTVPLGYHKYPWLEVCTSAATVTFYGNDSASMRSTGLIGSIDY